MSRRGRLPLVFSLVVLMAGIGVAVWMKRGPAHSSAQYVPRPPGTLTFNKDIAPIIFNHCSGCHRPGETAPHSFLSYQEVKKRAKQIAEVTASGYMPPWLPERGYAAFADERRLTMHQIGAIQQWVAEGAMEGKASDLPSLPRWPEGWQLGKPDLVVSMPEAYTLPAEGKDVYRNFVIPIPLSQPTYVQALEFRPGNWKIVHHAAMSFDQTGDARRQDQRDPAPGFTGIHSSGSTHTPIGHFLSWQPGKLPSKAPQGLAWKLEPNTDMVLQVHMQPTGKPEVLQSSVGFYFTDRPPTNTPIKIFLSSYNINIAAGTKDYVLEDSYVLPVDIEVLAVLPHAHYLAREMQGYALLPDGSRQWLIFIKRWDFNWQGDYRYRKPIFLPGGTKLVMHYTYDNSDDNVANPNHPARSVQYGLQSTDEMGELWFQVLARSKRDLALLSRDVEARIIKDTLPYNEYLLRNNPDDAKAHLGLAKGLYFFQRNNEAWDHLQTALRLQPDLEEPHYYLGLMLRRANKTREAILEFEEVLRLNSGHAKAHGNLGLIYFQEGNWEAAQNHLQSALRINPEDELARQTLDKIAVARRRQNR